MLAGHDTANELKVETPFSLVIFGASGHLAKLKLYPALYVLALKKRMPKDYAIVGYARTAMDDASFRALVEEAIRKAMPAVTEKALADFLTHVHYVQGAYDVDGDFAALGKKLDSLEKGDGTVRMAYLSIPPTVFSDVVRRLCIGGIHTKGKPFRCIVEKPVGKDLVSAEEVWETLTDCFEEEEIFLLDHYIGKEAVRNIYYLRFANPVLERMLKNTLIRDIEIVADEIAGLDGRAGYFEGIGMLRDWVQSHLLQIASLLTMRLKGEEELRASRLNALTQFYLPPAASMDDIVLQGQYTAGKSGGAYRDEDGVAKDSRTNTYVALKLMSRMSRFEGVPLFFHCGKRLDKKETRISIRFQEPHTVGQGAGPNRLDIILLGEAGMRLHLQTKVGGSEPTFRPLVMEDPLVCVGDCLPEHGLLLLEAIRGKQQWFLTMDEVRAAWRLIDPIQAHLEKPETPLALYESGANRPKEADAWMKKQGYQWYT